MALARPVLSGRSWCEEIAGKVGGIAVIIGSRVKDRAGPSEVLVSSTVEDLVSGSGIEFEDRGTHALKGVPGGLALVSRDARLSEVQAYHRRERRDRKRCPAWTEVLR